MYKRFGQYIFRWAATGNDFKPLVNKGKAAVEVGFSVILYEDSEYLFIIEGRLDLITEVNEVTFWVDHKSQERFATLYRFKPQFMTYALATKLPGIINYIGLQKELQNNSLRRTELITFPKWRLDAWETYLISNVFIPLAKTLALNKGFQSNYESCGGSFDSYPCQFTEICECGSEEMKEQVKKFKYVEIERWKPW